MSKILWRRKWQPTPVFLPKKTPWMEEPVGLQSKGSQRVRHTTEGLSTHMHSCPQILDLNFRDKKFVWKNAWTSVQFSCSVMSDSLWPRGLQHARLPCPSLSPRVCSNSCPLSQWCHPTISSSVALFSFCLQSFSASGAFPASQFFHSVVKDHWEFFFPRRYLLWNIKWAGNGWIIASFAHSLLISLCTFMATSYARAQDTAVTGKVFLLQWANTQRGRDKQELVAAPWVVWRQEALEQPRPRRLRECSF